jgi:hypothetical protein
VDGPSPSPKLHHHHHPSLPSNPQPTNKKKNKSACISSIHKHAPLPSHWKDFHPALVLAKEKNAPLTCDMMETPDFPPNTNSRALTLWRIIAGGLAYVYIYITYFTPLFLAECWWEGLCGHVDGDGDVHAVLFCFVSLCAGL